MDKLAIPAAGGLVVVGGVKLVALAAKGICWAFAGALALFARTAETGYSATTANSTFEQQTQTDWKYYQEQQKQNTYNPYQVHMEHQEYMTEEEAGEQVLDVVSDIGQEMLDKAIEQDTVQKKYL